MFSSSVANIGITVYGGYKGGNQDLNLDFLAADATDILGDTAMAIT